MSGAVWIQITDPKAQSWRLDLVDSERKATALSSVDARQAEHAARSAYQGFRWQSVQVSGDIYVVMGTKK
jgi:hypothetical protein